MAEFKLVISDPKSGKSLQKEVKEDAAAALVGKKIGDKVPGDSFELAGYELQITGGSDHCGFPMRSDADGSARKRIFAASGVGITDKKRLPNPKKKGVRHIKGMRRKKTVAGNTVHERTAQINLKVLKAGSAPLFEEKKEAAPEGEAPKAEAPAEAPKEEAAPAAE